MSPGFAEFSNSQRVLWDWFERRRKNTPEDLRLALIGVLGLLANLLRKHDSLKTPDVVDAVGRVGILYIALCSITDPGQPLVWGGAPEDDPIPTTQAQSHMLARVLECAREEFPRIRFYRVVRCLCAACEATPDQVVGIFIRAIDEVIHRTDVPQGL